MADDRESLRRLAAIRVAILFGVLAFGAIAWFQHRAPDWMPPEGVRMRPLRLAGMAAWGVALVGIIGLRVAYARVVDAGQRPRVAIIAWALGELPALFGAAYFYITGDLALFAAGVGALMVAFVLFPLAPRPPR